MNDKNPLQLLLNFIRFVNEIKQYWRLKDYGKLDLWICNFTKITINLQTKTDSNRPFSIWKMDFRDPLTPNYITNEDIGEMSVGCVWFVSCGFFFFFFWLYWVSAAVHELLLLPHSMWDLRSQTRDQTHNPWIGKWILSHWTTREVPIWCVLVQTK